MPRISRSSVVIALTYPVAVAALCFAVLNSDSRVSSKPAPAAQLVDQSQPTTLDPIGAALADAR
jgi:hypothetical protein